jgi:hypothetical protein
MVTAGGERTTGGSYCSDEGTVGGFPPPAGVFGGFAATTICTVDRRGSGVLLLDTLLRRKEARVQLTWRNRSLTSIVVLADIIVVVVKPVQDIRDEILGTEWLTDGSKSVGEARDLVEVLGDGAIEQLNLVKMSADGVSPCPRLRREARMESTPRLPDACS